MRAPARRLLLAWLAGGAAAAEAGPLAALLAGRAAERGDEAADEADGQGRSDVALPPGARAERDLAYGDDARQRLDVYLPAQAAKAPILLLVHGGAWMVGDKGNRAVVQNKVAHWLPRGYIVATANYRMTRQAPNPLQQADDVARALAFVQKQAPGWGGDPARVVLIGHSSGAHLVALLAADPQIGERQGAKPALGTVALDSAAYDIVEIMERRHYPFYDRVFGADRERWRDSSPLHRLAGVPKPLLLVCSSQRGDSCPQAQRFAARATAAGGQATVLPVDLAHGALNADLGKAADYTARVDAFLKSLGLP